MENKSIYEFIEKTLIKDTSGHYLNKYKCKICGKIVIRRKGFADYTYNCHHNFIKHINNKKYEINKRIHRIYAQIICRCYNHNSKDFKRYGKRNIKMYDDWLNDYFEFQNWSIKNGYKDNLTIDRIDVNGNYEPNNCRWITQRENSKFKSTTNYITINGETNSGIGWSKKINKSKNYINSMIRKHGIEYAINYLEENL